MTEITKERVRRVILQMKKKKSGGGTGAASPHDLGFRVFKLAESNFKVWDSEASKEAGGLVEQEKQGRHRYYRLTGEDIAGLLEMLEGLAARVGHMRVRTGPKDPELRRARICYDHLAGDLGVQMLDSMRERRLVRQKKQEIELTAEGTRFLAEKLQIWPDMLKHPRRPVCKACLDWSERRHHLAGTLGAALMQRFAELKWAARDATPGSRIVNFSRLGEKQFAALFGNNTS